MPLFGPSSHCSPPSVCSVPSPQNGPYLHCVVQPLYAVSLLFMPLQAGSCGVTPAFPQSHSSPPVFTPSPQCGPHWVWVVENPLSVSWKFDSVGWPSRLKMAISYVLPVFRPKGTVRVRQSQVLSPARQLPVPTELK